MTTGAPLVIIAGLQLATGIRPVGRKAHNADSPPGQAGIQLEFKTGTPAPSQ
jgi:hypothetical protein